MKDGDAEDLREARQLIDRWRAIQKRPTYSKISFHVEQQHIHGTTVSYIVMLGWRHSDDPSKSDTWSYASGTGPGYLKAAMKAINQAPGRRQVL